MLFPPETFAACGVTLIAMLGIAGRRVTSEVADFEGSATDVTFTVVVCWVLMELGAV
jgi:hypothetical protein